MCPVWREVAGSAIIGEHSIGHLPGQEERTLQPFIASSIKWDCGPTCAATNGPTHSCTWRATEKDGAVNRCACCNTFCREINNLRAAVLPDVFHLCADFVLSGYFRGKRNVEAALRQRPITRTVILAMQRHIKVGACCLKYWKYCTPVHLLQHSPAIHFHLTSQHVAREDLRLLPLHCPKQVCRQA